MQHAKPTLTVVTTSDPVARNLPRLLSALSRLAVHSAETIEVIIVDDLKYWPTKEAAAPPSYPGLLTRTIWYPERVGQLAAVIRGLQTATAEQVLTIDPDMYKCTTEVPKMRRLLTGDTCIVHGYRCNRRDASYVRRAGSWLANALVRHITGIQVPDIGSPIALLKHDVLAEHLIDEGNPRLNAYIELGTRVAAYPLENGADRNTPSQYSPYNLLVTLFQLIRSASVARRKLKQSSQSIT